MRKKLTYYGAVVLFSALTLTSCSDFDNNMSENELRYNQSFIDEFGEIDPNQDWNSATRISADVDLSGITDEPATVIVYTKNPVSGGKVCAHYEVNSNGNFTFDLPKTKSNVYISVMNSAKKTLYDAYVPVKDGKVSICKNATRAATSDVCNTTKSTKTRQQTGTFITNYDENYVRYDGTKTDSYGNVIKTRSGNYSDITLYYLDNVSKSDDNPGWSVEDLSAVVGQGGSFSRTTPAGFNYTVTFDTGYFAEGSNNRELYKDKFKKDVIFTMDEEGPVTVRNQFGGTAYTNQFGYYYWYDGATDAETLKNKINAKKYVIMDWAEPQNNIKVDGVAFTDGMYLPNQIISGYYNGYKPVGHSTVVKGEWMVVGSEYRLVYFPEDYGQSGQPTFNFPQGIHIAFFIKTLANNYNTAGEAGENTEARETAEKRGGNISYSDSELNGYYGHLYSGNIQDIDCVPDWESVTYSAYSSYTDGDKEYITSTTVVGFEDGSDKDLNDILFFVYGVTPSEHIESKTSKLEWTIACEDLGTTDDFDFNDLVFKVGHTSGETKATVTPLASGGTLAATIWRNDTQIGGKEFHQLLKDGASSTEMINTSTRGVSGTPIEIEVPEDFTLAYSDEVFGSSNMGGFEIHVDGREKASTTVATSSSADVIAAPEKGKIPQMILIEDAGWAWPTERTNILTAYPNFSNFVSNPKENLRWYDEWNSNYVVEHTSTGEGTISAGGSTGQKIYLVSPIMKISNQVLSPSEKKNLQITFGEQSDGTTTGTKAFGSVSLITMTSSDESICKVVYYPSSGYYNIIAGDKEGEATITVTHAGDGESYMQTIKTFTVTVSNAATDENSITYDLTIPTIPDAVYTTSYNNQTAYTFDVSGSDIDWNNVTEAKLHIETAGNNVVTIYKGSSWDVFLSTAQQLQTPITTTNLYLWGFDSTKKFSVFSSSAMTITKCQLILTKSL